MGGKAREKMSWEKIDSSTYQYDEGGVRFFLLIGKKEALLIDSGMQTHNAKELAKELTDAKKELFNLRFQNATNQLENTGEIKNVRKNIARIQTVMVEKKEA